MTTPSDRGARHDPKAVENDWLGATQEGTGEEWERGATAKARGESTEGLYPPDDDPVVNGYQNTNTSLTEPPGPENQAAMRGRPKA
jgi:hypothetical protein